MKQGQLFTPKRPHRWWLCPNCGLSFYRRTSPRCCGTWCAPDNRTRKDKKARLDMRRLLRDERGARPNDPDWQTVCTNFRNEHPGWSIDSIIDLYREIEVEEDVRADAEDIRAETSDHRDS